MPVTQYAKAPDTVDLAYQASPTLSKLHADNTSFVKGVRGPIGSGKSVGCINDLIYRSLDQRPNKAGIRKTRWAMVRATYPELKSTTIKTFQDWLPETICPIRMNDSPIVGTFTMPMPDGTLVVAEFLFIALDKPKDLGKLLSLELTGAFLNEAKEVPKEVIDGLTSRVGRYPAKRDGGPSWTGVVMDTNAPDSNHWWADLERKCPDKWKFYVQPAALIEDMPNEYIPNPDAENVEHQPKGYDYWLDAISGKEPSWIQAYVLNQFALVSAGKPVYSESFSERFHVAKNQLWPVDNRQIIVGFDFGLTPAAVFGQIQENGQLRILDCVVATRMGFEQFVVEGILPLIASKYHRQEIAYVGDPSGTRASDTDEKSCYDIGKRYNISILPASTNNIAPRLDGVRSWLMRTVGRAEAAFLLSPHCYDLVQGFANGYEYQRVQVSGEARYRDKPNKNRFSHPMDALQYMVDRVNTLTRRAEQPDIPTTGTMFRPADTLTGY